MYNACIAGHLGIVKWLYLVGAAKELKDRSLNDGFTLMQVARVRGHFGSAKWLFEVGDAEDIKSSGTSIFKDPLALAASKDRPLITAWLVLQGAANDKSGHADEAILARDIFSETKPRADLHQNLSALLDNHLIFTTLVLPAICNAQTFASAMPSAEVPASARSSMRSKKPRVLWGLRRWPG